MVVEGELGTAPVEDPRTALVEQARAGDAESFGALVEGAWRDLVGLARAVLGECERDAEDVVQEACVAAWRHLSALRRASSFDAWIRRSVVRRCWRRLSREEVPPCSPLGETGAVPEESWLDVRRCLARLTPRQRAVVYLTAVEGRTDGEIARALGMLPTTVRTHRRRARKALRRLLGGSR